MLCDFLRRECGVGLNSEVSDGGGIDGRGTRGRKSGHGVGCEKSGLDRMNDVLDPDLVRQGGGVVYAVVGVDVG